MIAGFWLGLKYLCAMNGDRDRNEARRRQRLLRIGAIAGAALAALCAQFAIYLTCLDLEDERKTTWSLEETNAFVDYLHENRSQVDDSGNFKTATFTAAADAILPLRKNGPRKTRQMCRERWSSVSDSYVLPCLQLTIISSSNLSTPVSRIIKQHQRDCPTVRVDLTSITQEKRASGMTILPKRCVGSWCHVHASTNI